MYDIEAKLKWTTLENGELAEKSLDIFVKEESITRSEFYASIQSGMTISTIYTMNSFDYEATKHLEYDTKRTLYATTLEVEGADYNISRTYKKKDSEEIELICT